MPGGGDARGGGVTAAAFGGGREWGPSESRSPSQSESLIESFFFFAAKMLSMITVIFRCEDEEKGLAESGGEDDVQKHSDREAPPRERLGGAP